MMRVSGIVVAGGKGIRMGGPTPKQYIEIGGKPILVHTLERLHEYDVSACWIVVVPQADIAYVRGLCETYLPSCEVAVTAGGHTRTESVYNGLRLLPRQVERVAIHDGVRPMISHDLVKRLFREQAPVVVPVVPCTDSLRVIDGTGSRAVDRSIFRSVQTPQVFDRECIEEAYRLFFQTQPTASYTDDASLVEGILGISPTLVEGESENIKITSPKDLAVAQWILEDKINPHNHGQ